jgi:peptide/nickel transport system permease protein
MIGNVISRLLQVLPTLFGVLVLVFAMTHVLPGDPARLIAGPEATDAEVAGLRADLGLDQPVGAQFITYLSNLSRGEMGRSLHSNRPVVDELAARLPRTLILTGFALAIMISLGLAAGIISAIKPDSLRDHLLTGLSLTGISVPLFWLGLMLVLVFSYHLRWLPTGGTSSLRGYILPAVTLGLGAAAMLARLMRSSLLDIIHQDYIRTARAKGAREAVVIGRHALRNALIPAVTLIGLEAGILLGGAVIVETIFSINGIGRYLVQSIQYRDYPATQGAVLVIAVIFITVNLLTDLSYGLLDPRQRRGAA